MKEIKTITAMEAIKAMLLGLRKTETRDDFILDLNTFGENNEEGICVGCAATVAIQELNSRLFKPNEISNTVRRAKACKQKPYIFNAFESAIDDFRLGKEKELAIFCKFFNIDINKLTPPTWYIWHPNCTNEMIKIELWVQKNRKLLDTNSKIFNRKLENTGK